MRGRYNLHMIVRIGCRVTARTEKFMLRILGYGGRVTKSENYDASLVDEIITVSEQDAYITAQRLAQNEGILCGITSGAALFAATVLSHKNEYKDKTTVVLLPDTGDRYLSTPLFDKI